MEKFSESAKIFYYRTVRKPKMSPNYELMLQIRDTSQRLQSAYNRFENESNEDLLDSVIYEIKSLKALYRYLLKCAREKGLQCGEITVFGKEVI